MEGDRGDYEIAEINMAKISDTTWQVCSNHAESTRVMFHEGSNQS